ncbi:protein NUCLEAR FUSION DEFECTIVE 6, chloroplastic/mitochondrial-like [Iris pallida]|uniref:Protein NUCLEAR FUSION DEFECTIVE 6, chloroplastic/mitochondrial-like n=1 Tax=Iris pallida TaxID=29817 RepID=A0AAX6G6L4_IRIPA|nr:protein NUCLEAR FUSION DEFECTIVE 6, chloroplastic/mitochondrial-like [Iris pallida]KAJ6831966.1 protein NUCLEAR FUSION DEFECTIVE 6, chloroplastic/mitochondrial-like [Iris pallida]
MHNITASALMTSLSVTLSLEEDMAGSPMVISLCSLSLSFLLLSFSLLIIFRKGHNFEGIRDFRLFLFTLSYFCEITAFLSIQMNLEERTLTSM